MSVEHRRRWVQSSWFAVFPLLIQGFPIQNKKQNTEVSYVLKCLGDGMYYSFFSSVYLRMFVRTHTKSVSPSAFKNIGTARVGINTLRFYAHARTDATNKRKLNHTSVSVMCATNKGITRSHFCATCSLELLC